MNVIRRVSKYIYMLPESIRNFVAVMGVLIALGDFVFTLMSITVSGTVMGVVVMFSTVIGLLPSLRISRPVAVAIGYIGTVLAVVALSVPWILCRRMPSEEGLCGCFEDRNVLQALIIIGAAIAACFAYYLV